MTHAKEFKNESIEKRWYKIFSILSTILGLVAIIVAFMLPILNKQIDLQVVRILLATTLIFGLALLYCFLKIKGKKTKKRVRKIEIFVLIILLIILIFVICIFNSIIFYLCGNGVITEENMQYYEQLYKNGHNKSEEILINYYTDFFTNNIVVYQEQTNLFDKYLIYDEFKKYKNKEYFSKLPEEVRKLCFDIIMEYDNDIKISSQKIVKDEKSNNVIQEQVKKAEMFFIEGNYEETLSIYKDLLTTGYQDYIIYNNLGYLFSKGYGVEKNINKASAYYKLSYDLGNNVGLGNVILLDLKNIDTWELVINNINCGKECEDERIETLFFLIYSELDMLSSTNSYYLDFLSKTEKEQLNILKQIGTRHVIVDVFFTNGDVAYSKSKANRLKFDYEGSIYNPEEGTDSFKYEVYRNEINLDYDLDEIFILKQSVGG